MTEFILHALVLPMTGAPAIIPISGAYQWDSRAALIDNHQVLIAAVDSEIMLRDQAEVRSVDSLTVVYGMNGGGKTRLLLDICTTFSRDGGELALGFLWEHDGALYFDPGSHLAKLRVMLADREVQHRPVSRRSVPFGTVFYTTSPFEATRRRLTLAESATVDVTPSFGVDNPFAGIALLRAARALPKDLPFIQHMEVALKVKVPSLRSLIEVYTAEPKRRFNLSESKLRQLSERARTALRDLPGALSSYMSHVLAIEMQRARVEGDEAMEELRRDLLRAISRFGEDKGVAQLLSSRAASHATSSFDIFRALDITRMVGPEQLSRKAAFKDYVSQAQEWSDGIEEGLRQAERLGILKWSFLNLSSGQVAMLMLFASLAGALSTFIEVGARCLMMTVDEGEMFMHPAWQRTYLSRLTEFLASYRSNFDAIHLVLSTHSLIVAGDAPPNRLFDVESGQMQNGFAAAPEELLKSVYHVADFAGELAEARYMKIGDYLRQGGTEDDARTVLALVTQIASGRLRTYLEAEVIRRMDLDRAKA